MSQQQVFRVAALAAGLLSLALAFDAGGQLSRSDRKFLEDATHANLAEIELGKLATRKAANEQVKEYGGRMVRDHEQANEELRKAATARGIELPPLLDRPASRELARLQDLGGAEFDRRYTQRMVEHHRREFRRTEKKAKGVKVDADVLSYAQRMLPMLHDHLVQAEGLARVTAARK
jgi:putative membrane protein